MHSRCLEVVGRCGHSGSCLGLIDTSLFTNLLSPRIRVLYVYIHVSSLNRFDDLRHTPCHVNAPASVMLVGNILFLKTPELLINTDSIL